MAIIAIYSVKGGVGKTTLSANLAWCSATISRRDTLLWDLDHAGGSGFLLGVYPKPKRRAASLMARERDAASLIRHTGYSKLDLLPADSSLRELDRQLLQIGKRKRLSKIAQGLSKDYQRIILDCPPVMNEISAQIMRAADLIIVPMPPSPLSARAFELVAEEVRQNTKIQPPMLPVLSMLDLRRTLHREAQEANPDWPTIPMASAVEQCAVRQEPVGAFQPRSPAAVAFRRLWTAIERKLDTMKL